MIATECAEGAELKGVGERGLPNAVRPGEADNETRRVGYAVNEPTRLETWLGGQSKRASAALD